MILSIHVTGNTLGCEKDARGGVESIQAAHRISRELRAGLAAKVAQQAAAGGAQSQAWASVLLDPGCPCLALQKLCVLFPPSCVSQ